MNFLKFSLLTLLFLAFYGCKSASEKTIQVTDKLKQPNFIFYLADDQDQLDYGCYGNPNVSTLNVDKLAEEGMRFTNFYTAQAICAPARSQIYTGMYPVKSGAMANHIGVKPNIKSVTNYLQNAGYEVVLAGKSHVKPKQVFNWTNEFKPINHRWLPLDEIDTYLKNVKKPFCLFITSDLPHGPYPKTKKYTKKDIFKLPYFEGDGGNFRTGYYQNLDDDNIQLGKVLKMVDDNGFRDNSMFIYASDHGISGKWSLSEQGTKVPFIVRWPGIVKPKTVSSTVLNFVDVLPTFLEAAHTKRPESIDGKSFIKTLKGSEEKIHDYIYGVQTNQNIQACKIFPSRMVRGEKLKLIINYNALERLDYNLGDNPVVNEFITIGAKHFPNTPYEELYDLSVDPYQTNNLANNPSYKTEKVVLAAALKKWMESQNDFLLTYKMPLIKTTYPLDKASKWHTPPKHLKGKLKPEDYIKLHY